MADYKKLLKLLKKPELKKLEEYAGSQIKSYNKLIEHSPCKTDTNRQPCHITDKGEPLCAQTLEEVSLLKTAMDNLREGNYIPPTRGENALAGQNDIMDKSPEEQKRFAVKAVKMAIKNVVNCLPMPCRKNICKQIESNYELNEVSYQKADSECKRYNLDLSPEGLIKMTINKRLTKPSVCFARRDGAKKTLESVICMHIAGQALDCYKAGTYTFNKEEGVDPSNVGGGSVELQILHQELVQKIIDDISRIPNDRMRKRVLMLFEAIINGDIDVKKNTDTENATKLGLTVPQYRYARNILMAIVETHISLEELQNMRANMEEYYIEPNDEND
ncbi:MAG: hypothetical protein DRR19_07930 [Candidatus Parabeggiatoa sp. nov. 1]|nr:MAG: hypothetical protein DRR19_07930 [Gammaproteobacteria bacterium]